MLFVYSLYHYVGFRKHGFVGYIKHQLCRRASRSILVLIVPIELFTKFIIEPALAGPPGLRRHVRGPPDPLVFTVVGEFLLFSGGALLMAGFGRRVPSPSR